MIINGPMLLACAPIRGMETEKQRFRGTSYGLSEAGYDIRIKQDVHLSPNKRFILASSIEEFNMPNDLVGIVHDKSTWARQGLSVFNTVIEPGWKGFLTLELVYQDSGVLVIPAGSGIAQVLFHQVSWPTNYKGKYQNQQDQPVQAILD